MLSSRGRAHRAVLVSALRAGATFAHAQRFPSIESLSESYVTCVQSAFARRLDESAANGDLPQATERALLDCEMEKNDLYTTAVASTPGNTQAIALVHAAVAAHRTLIPDKGLSPNRCPIATSVANTREETTNWRGYLLHGRLHEEFVPRDH
jgi:hypothetical protein